MQKAALWIELSESGKLKWKAVSYQLFSGSGFDAPKGSPAPTLHNCKAVLGKPKVSLQISSPAEFI